MNIYKCKLNGVFYVVTEKYDDKYVRAINIEDKYSYTIPVEDLELWLTKEEQQPTGAKETIVKSALKYLVKMQIEEGSVGFAADNDHDHDCCWDDVLAWIEAQPSEDCVSREAVKEQMIKYGFKAPDMTVTEFVEDCLPSVTPQPEKGKWTRDLRMWFTRFSCSNCGKFCDFDYFCCPYCGQKKEGVEDEVSD